MRRAPRKGAHYAKASFDPEHDTDPSTDPSVEMRLEAVLASELPKMQTCNHANMQTHASLRQENRDSEVAKVIYQ